MWCFDQNDLLVSDVYNSSFIFETTITDKSDEYWTICFANFLFDNLDLKKSMQNLAGIFLKIVKSGHFTMEKCEFFNKILTKFYRDF